MLHFDRWKIIAIVLTCLAGVLFTLPNFFSKETVDSWPRWVPHQQLPLGLDLRGGAHLLLAMETNELGKDWLNTLRDDARKQLREAKIGFTGLGIAGNSVQVRVTKPEDMDKACTALKKLIQPIGNAILGSGGNDITVEKAPPDIITLAPTEQGTAAPRIAAPSSAAIETVSRRVNAMGTAESTVVRQGSDRILVQSPACRTPSSSRSSSVRRRKLTLPRGAPDDVGRGGQADARRRPATRSIRRARARASAATCCRRRRSCRGEELVDAQPGFDSRTNEPIISFRFNQSGARKFGKFTKDNVGSAVRHRARRQGALGARRSASRSSAARARSAAASRSRPPTQLAIQLRSGALPAKLTIVEERTVGPSLGADSIEAGKLAGLVGGFAHRHLDHRRLRHVRRLRRGRPLACTAS